MGRALLDAAVAFYERLGWRHVDSRPADWTAHDGRRRTVYLAPRRPPGYSQS